MLIFNWISANCYRHCNLINKIKIIPDVVPEKPGVESQAPNEECAAAAESGEPENEVHLNTQK
jgi:hypothetical protein